jgi:hypothetical protein
VHFIKGFNLWVKWLVLRDEVTPWSLSARGLREGEETVLQLLVPVEVRPDFGLQQVDKPLLFGVLPDI